MTQSKRWLPVTLCAGLAVLGCSSDSDPQSPGSGGGAGTGAVAGGSGGSSSVGGSGSGGAGLGGTAGSGGSGPAAESGSGGVGGTAGTGGGGNASPLPETTGDCRFEADRVEELHTTEADWQIGGEDPFVARLIEPWVISDVAVGDTIALRVTLDPPLTVTDDLVGTGFWVGLRSSVRYNLGEADTRFVVVGDPPWEVVMAGGEVHAALDGSIGGGSFQAAVSALSGSTLRCMGVIFTVPEHFTLTGQDVDVLPGTMTFDIIEASVRSAGPNNPFAFQ